VTLVSLAVLAQISLPFNSPCQRAAIRRGVGDRLMLDGPPIWRIFRCRKIDRPSYRADSGSLIPSTQSCRTDFSMSSH
jgi:hypothetical protein